jgi:hypothetical protein
MSKNEYNSQQDQKETREIFARVQAADIQAPLYMKTRVLARVNERRQNRTLLFWKLLSAGSLMSVVILGFLSFSLYHKENLDGVTQQAYVIHIEFNESDKAMVAEAEIELPQDVHFVSKNKTIAQERKLRLPVEVRALGRGKLPFVVASDSSGEKAIKVRLLNEKDELVREQVLKLKFAKQGATITF